MQINVHSRPDPPKHFSKSVWFRDGFNGEPVWYFVAQVVQSVFNCNLVIDGPIRPISEGNTILDVYIDGQDNINWDVDKRLEGYIQDYVHSVYPNIDVYIQTHNSFVVVRGWERDEELWSHFNFFGYGLPANFSHEDIIWHGPGPVRN